MASSFLPTFVPPQLNSIDDYVSYISSIFTHIVTLPLIHFTLSSLGIFPTLSVLSYLAAIINIGYKLYTVYFNAVIKKKAQDWEDDIVVVTGGSGGIGSLFIQELLKKHGNVKKIVSMDVVEPKEKHDKVLFYKCNLADNDNIKSVCAKIKSEVGTPTILVNNAGIRQGKYVTDLTDDQIEKTIVINQVSHFTLIKQFLPDMLSSQRGHILATISAFAYGFGAGLVDYGSSKHGSLGLYQGLRQELRFTPIKTSYLLPGHIRTPLFTDFQFKYPFLMPVLEPIQVVDDMITTLENNVSSSTARPLLSNTLPLLGLFNVRLVDWLVETIGMNNALLSLHVPEYGKQKKPVDVPRIKTVPPQKED
ncbi:hypothetical protein BKA69DRAFT_1126903 [Paraphysoderma sedebokerense]|nr:hypothetical protein BKA69DRAFT_1126903 [Paraphysoderma sedebokerense]